MRRTTLNARDAKRFHDLLVRICLQTPMTEAEHAEYEKLVLLRRRLMLNDPEYRRYLDACNTSLRKVQRLRLKLERKLREIESSGGVASAAGKQRMSGRGSRSARHSSRARIPRGT